MKKKISAICLAITMLSSAMPMAQAGILDDLGGATVGLNVPADMKVCWDGGVFVNGPIENNSDETAQTKKVDYQAIIDMGEVVNHIQLYKSVAAAEGKNEGDAVANGQFVVTIKDTTTDPAKKIDLQKLVDNNAFKFSFTDFNAVNDPITNVFDAPQYVVDATNQTVTITVKVKDNLTIDKIDSNFGISTDETGKVVSYNSIVLVCEDVEINDFGTYTVVGEVTGTMTVGYLNNPRQTINYTFTQKAGEEDSAGTAGDISATVKYVKKTTGGSSSGGSLDYDVSDKPVSNKKTITIVVGGDEENIVLTYDAGTIVPVTEITKPSRAGYIFEGFYTDAECTTPVAEEIAVNDNMTIYADWTALDTEILEMEKHYAYIIGYPTDDGQELVKPANDITREEIATIFYRLLRPEPRQQLHTLENDFTDVESTRWSNEAISTIANGGYVKGYEDGSFKPANPITRAEFVTIAGRLFGMKDAVEPSTLSDISGHWAEAAINYAAGKGWVNGYEDGTFQPDKFITRAEVMKIVNGMLNRKVDAEGVAADAKTWDDNSASAWYYYEVIEATNAHIYNKEDGSNIELWQEVVENDLLANKIEPEKVQVEVVVEPTEETNTEDVVEEEVTGETTEETTEDVAEETTEETTEEETTEEVTE